MGKYLDFFVMFGLSSLMLFVALFVVYLIKYDLLIGNISLALLIIAVPTLLISVPIKLLKK